AAGPTGVADLAPEPFEAGARFVWAALRQARGQQDRVHGSCAGPAHGVEGDGVLFEQPVEHAPGERAESTPALQGERGGPAHWLRVRAVSTEKRIEAEFH